MLVCRREVYVAIISKRRVADRSHPARKRVNPDTRMTVYDSPNHELAACTRKFNENQLGGNNAHLDIDNTIAAI